MWTFYIDSSFYSIFVDVYFLCFGLTPAGWKKVFQKDFRSQNIVRLRIQNRNMAESEKQPRKKKNNVIIHLYGQGLPYKSASSCLVQAPGTPRITGSIKCTLQKCMCIADAAYPSNLCQLCKIHLYNYGNCNYLAVQRTDKNVGLVQLYTKATWTTAQQKSRGAVLLTPSPN